VIKAADYIIDLGPEGGDRGGEIVASGSPRELLSKTERSYTARYLKAYLQERGGG
jgi:excinuclease ABC subunit A